MLIALDRFGRIVLPKALRDDFALRPGDRMEVVKQADHVELRPVHERQPIRSDGGILVFSGRSEGNLAEAIHQDREQRLQKLTGRGGKP